MNFKQALSHGRELLTAKSIDDAPLECELLLRHTLNIDRVQLYLHLDDELTPGQEAAFLQLVKRRLSHEPTAYITGHCEFYGLDFYVDPRVLIPRPESELLVEEVLNIAASSPAKQNRTCVIAEVGTGSGAIAISLARHLPQAQILASDISDKALEVAFINCERHEVTGQIQLFQGNMLEALPGQFDIIVANLPYVTQQDIKGLSPEIQIYEPTLALDGGEDGLDKIRGLVSQAVSRLRHNGHFLLEIGDGQCEQVTSFIRHFFPSARIETRADLGDIDRVVSVSLDTQLHRC